MDTESSLFIGALCFLSVAAISILHALKVRSCSYTFLTDDIIPIIDTCNSTARRCHTCSGGKPWFDKLTITGCVTLSLPVRQAGLSKGIAPGDSPRIKDCGNENFKSYFPADDETVNLPGRNIK